VSNVLASTKAAFQANPEDERHGTVNGYVNLGCRCDRCRGAQRDYCRDYTHRTGRRRPREQWLSERRTQAESRDNHGSETRYSRGCRCEPCRRAAADARARRRLMPAVSRHGVYSSYSNGCRCDECRAAYAKHRREQRARKRAAA